VSQFHPQAPWEFLLSASRNLDQWLEENASAMLARWLIENRERSVLAGDSAQSSEQVSSNGRAVSDNVLTDHPPPPRSSRSRS
jgi:hypothetical protein